MRLAACLAALLLLAGPAAAQQPVTVPDPLVVGVSDLPPFALKGADGAWDGVAVHLWREAADALDVTYELREVARGAQVAGIVDGTLHAALTAHAAAADERRVDFTQPYHTAALGVAQPRFDGLVDIAARFFSARFFWIVAWLSALLLVVGAVMWLIERKANGDQFSGPPLRGIGDGFWWAGVTMTTIGYGDKAPVTALGRAVALLWMLVAMAVTASLTAALVSVVGAGPGSLQLPDDLRGVAVGAVPDTPGARYLEQERVAFTAYEELAAGLDDVAARRLDAFVGTAAVLRDLVDQGGRNTVRVTATRYAAEPFAVALPEGSPLREPLDRLILDKTTTAAWRDLLDRYVPRGN